MLIRAKKLIPKTAKKLGLPEELVSDVIDFYYTELRKEVEELKVTRIKVPVLGTFYFSKKKIEESINTLTYLTSKDIPKDFRQITIRNKRLELIEQQKAFLEIRNKEDKEYDERKKDLG